MNGEERYVEILAHRGGSDGKYPENSIAAFTEGLRVGADILELDVRLTKDDEVVVIHDPTYLDHTGRECALRRMTCADVTGEREDPLTGIPRLATVLETFPHGRFNIDLKVQEPVLAEKVAALLTQYGVAEGTVVASFIPAALERFRSISEGIATSTHPGEVKRCLLGHLVGLSPKTPARVIQVPLRHRGIPVVTRRFIRYVHRWGYKIHVWTINDPVEAEWLANIGVDGIVTDRVAMIHETLKRSGYRSSGGGRGTP